MSPNSSVAPNRCFNARSNRNAWCRSPSNDSTVSTTCSSTSWTGQRAVFRDVTDEQRGRARVLREADEAVRGVAHLSDRAWRTRPVGIVHGLDGVDRDDRGPQLVDMGAHRGQRGLVDDEQIGRERAKPVGPHPHLRERLFGAHQQAPPPGRRDRPERLEHQRALAHARLTADEGHRARDQAAVEHPVDFGERRRQPRYAGDVDVGERYGRADHSHRDAAYRRLLAEGAPLPTVGASAEPLGRLEAASLTAKANVCSGHGRTVAPPLRQLVGQLRDAEAARPRRIPTSERIVRVWRWISSRMRRSRVQRLELVRALDRSYVARTVAVTARPSRRAAEPGARSCRSPIA